MASATTGYLPGLFAIAKTYSRSRISRAHTDAIVHDVIRSVVLSASASSKVFHQLSVVMANSERKFLWNSENPPLTHKTLGRGSNELKCYENKR